MNNLASLYFATGETANPAPLWRRPSKRIRHTIVTAEQSRGPRPLGGDNETAEVFLDRALALDPNYGDARINQALIARAEAISWRRRRELRGGDRTRARRHGAMELAFLDLAAGQTGEAAAGSKRLDGSWVIGRTF
jgi:hypothetical protein